MKDKLDALGRKLVHEVLLKQREQRRLPKNVLNARPVVVVFALVHEPRAVERQHHLRGALHGVNHNDAKKGNYAPVKDAVVAKLARVHNLQSLPEN